MANYPQSYFSASSDFCSALMMKSDARTLSTKSQTSQDSGYDSGWYPPREPAPESDSYLPREPAPEFGSGGCSPANWRYSDLSSQNQNRLYSQDQKIPSSGDRARRVRVSVPAPPRPQAEPSTSSKRAQKSTSSSPTSTPTSPKTKSYCCMYPECEAMFARPYDLGRHQKTRHANTKRYDCPEETCRRYGTPEYRGERGGFTRLDHFRDHVKNLHNKIVIKDKERDGGQHWVLDPMETDRRLWMRDETGSIRTKDSLGHIWVKDSKTGRWQQIS